MNVKDLINIVADHEGNPLNKTTGKVVVDLVFGAIIDALTKGDKVEVPGLGKLIVKDRAAKIGRNPKTGEQIQIAAKKAVAFQAAKALKDAV